MSSAILENEVKSTSYRYKILTIVLSVIFLTLLSNYKTIFVANSREEYLFQEELNEDAYIVILGGGVTGLCAARRLEELGYSQWTLIESSDDLGGLATTIEDEEGFRWDVGVHVLFSHFEYFDRLIDEAIPPKQWLYHRRKSPAYMRGKYVDYPVQDNLWQIGDAEAAEIIKDLNSTRDERAKCAEVTGKADFLKWMHTCFGVALTEAFGAPYNYKVWAYPPETMNSKWVGERVATIDVDEIIYETQNHIKHKSWGPNALFRYPANGTGTIWQGVGAALNPERIRLNHKVESLDAKTHSLHVRDEHNRTSVLRYNHLLSSMPMDKLLRFVDAHRYESYPLKDGFKRQTCHLVGVGITGELPEHLRGVHWLYFPESNVPFYRLSILTNLSPFMAPQPYKQYSVLTETSESPMKVLETDDLVKDVVDALRLIGVLPEGYVVASTWTRVFDYGYPVPYFWRDQHVHYADERLRSQGIWSRGRFGSWKYEVANQDHSCELGKEAIDSMLFGNTERTFRTPNKVNALYNAHVSPARVYNTTRARTLPKLEVWHFVMAHCSGSVDWIDTFMQRIPDDIKFHFFIYEVCVDEVPFSLEESLLHISRAPLPQQLHGHADAVFVHHIAEYYKGKLADYTFFLPESLVLHGANHRWMRCVGELREHLRQFPQFGYLSGGEYVHTALRNESPVCEEFDHLFHKTCPSGVGMCEHAPIYASMEVIQSNTLQWWKHRAAHPPQHMMLLWPFAFGQVESATVDPLACMRSDSVVIDPNGEARSAVSQQCASSIVEGSSDSVGSARNVFIITGGLGNIGLSLVRALLDTTKAKAYHNSSDTFVLVVIDNDMDRAIPVDLLHATMVGRLIVNRTDIRNYEELLTIFKQWAPRLRGMYHLAALSTVRDCEAHEDVCMGSNIHGTQNVLRALRETDTTKHLPWTVFSSSREVFGDTGDSVVNEFSEKRPLNVYGNSKLAAEAIVANHAALGYASVVVRFSNVYGGWEDHLSRVTPNFVCRAHSSLPLIVVGGKQQLNLLFIEDAVRSLLLAGAYAESVESGVVSSTPAHLIDYFNIATNRSIGIVDLAKEVVALTKSNSSINFRPAEQHFVDRYNTETTRATNVLKFTAQVSLDIGLVDFNRRYPFGRLGCDAAAIQHDHEKMDATTTTTTTRTTTTTTVLDVTTMEQVNVDAHDVEQPLPRGWK